MFRSYLKIAWRNLRKQRGLTFINVFGLTFGISCFLLIGLYVFDELTFDRQHRKTSRIYRAIQHKKTPTDNLTMAASSYKVAEETRKQIGEIENSAWINRTGRANITNLENKHSFQETTAFGSPGLLEMFDFTVLTGDGKSALDEPNSVIIVEELALRLFGTTDVVGKTIDFEFGRTKPLRITAVLKNHPRNSSFNFNSMISAATLQADDDFAEMTSDWDSQDFLTFFLLKPSADPTVAAQKITALLNANKQWQPGTSAQYSLQPLADIHLRSEGIVDRARNDNVEAIGQGDLRSVNVFALVALFVLLIACINYMNLATARASNRAKEIGVRKTNGAFKHHLIYQFLTESLLVTTGSFLLALALTNGLLPAFNEFTHKELSLGIHTDYRIWLFGLLALVITSLVSGSYPALLLSGFSPLALLKNLKIKGNLSLRQGLVVFQFTISVVMMIATIVLFQQIRFVSTKDLGFDKELLVVVDINSGEVRAGAETIKAEFSKISGVKNVAVTSRVPGEWKTIPTIKIRPQGKTSEHSVTYLIGADDNFMRTFDVRLVNGQNFRGMADSTSVLLNETAASLLGITEAAGQRVEIPSRSMGGSYQPLNQDEQPFQARVIGIVKDFHFQSLRKKIAPMVLAYQKNPVHSIDYFTARIDGRNVPTTLAKMNDVITKVDPTDLFEYHFLDEQLARFYAEDQRRQTLLIWVALTTIFIACLGLFGLATYAAEQRQKEIGVRKVLGASVASIVTLLSKDFLKLVLIAIVIASPLAWWAMSHWLQDFAYKIAIEWWVFGLAGLLAVGIALLTVSFQSVKAALMNPVKSLRSE